MELRTRVVDAYKRGEGSIRNLADRFVVHRNTVLSWLGLVEETGSVEPRPHGGGTPTVLTGENLQVLLDLVKQDPDATLEELVEMLRDKGIHTNDSSVSRALLGEKITRKKKPSLQSKRTPSRMKSSESSTAARSTG
jgi:transposase